MLVQWQNEQMNEWQAISQERPKITYHAQESLPGGLPPGTFLAYFVKSGQLVGGVDN